MSKSLLANLILFISLSLNAQINMGTTFVCPPCNNHCDQNVYDKPGVCEHCNMVLIREDLSKTIAFYLQDGVEVLDFAGPMEVLSYAGYKVFTVSATKAPIKSQGILTVTPDYSIKDAPKADILAFFGGNASAASKNEQVIEWVKGQENIQHYFSVCTGAFVLAEAGILDGNTATTFHNALDDLETNYPSIEVRRDVRFVDNGKVITTAGISAGIDGALHLVAKLQGINAAKRTAYYMEYDNWQIGNGLILTENNPYTETISKDVLETFKGTYEYRNGNKIEVVYDTKAQNLMAIVNGTGFPIYHEKGDIFSDVGSEPIFFKRDAENEIVGYAMSKSGKIYKKLSN